MDQVIRSASGLPAPGTGRTQAARRTLWRAGALGLFFVLAACGGPREPSEHTKPGALAKVFSSLTQDEKASTAEAKPAKKGPAPYVVIRFDRPGIVFSDALYTAMNRALARYPAVQFDVVLAMPPLTARADPDEALRRGEQHIEDVVLSMTDMGLPAERLRIAASTDIDVKTDEIRIYVR
jgi:hypothetical protein